MKNLFSVFILICAMTLVSCNSKEKERAKAKADSISYVMKQDSIKTAERTARRERLAKARSEKMEQRKQAWVEMYKSKPFYKDANGKMVYNKAEVDPIYPGGEMEMVKFLKDNIEYPRPALEKSAEGTVFVDFIIDQNGKVRNAVASETIGEDIDQALKDEALRVVNAMPVWEPGKNKNKPVDAYFSVPITFELDDNLKGSF
jgi:TonB family protein